MVVECGFGGFYLVIESCSWMWLLDVFFGGNYLLWLLVVLRGDMLAQASGQVL